MYTFVTGYIHLQDFESRPGTKTLDDYLQHCKPLLQCGLPIVVFCHQDAIQHIQQCVGSNDLVRIVSFTTKDMQHYSPAFFQTDLPNTRGLAKDTHWYMLTQLQKVHWLKHVASWNPFGTTHFCWLDIGINHNLNMTVAEFRHYLSALGDSDLITVGSSHDPRHNLSVDLFTCGILGSILAGNKEHIDWLAFQQDQMVHALLSRNKMTWEVTIWMMIYAKYPDKFRLYAAHYGRGMLELFPKAYICHNALAT